MGFGVVVMWAGMPTLLSAADGLNFQQIQGGQQIACGCFRGAAQGGQSIELIVETEGRAEAACL